MEILEKIKESIAFLSADLSKLQDPFYLIGSSALVLAGVPLVSADDIDLLTSHRDATFLKQHWQANRAVTYLPKDADKFRSNFGRFRWDIALVEVMGDLEVFQHGKWEKLTINDYYEILIGPLNIRIPTLKEQYRILKLFGRVKDLEKADKLVKHI